MNRILITIACCLVLLACKKNESVNEVGPVGSSQKIPLSFDVSGFTQISTPITNSHKTSSSLKTDAATFQFYNCKLMYIVYDKTGKQVSRLEQNINYPGNLYRIAGDSKLLVNTKSPYGSITDSLAAGTYTLVAIQTSNQGSLNRLYEGYVDKDGTPAYPEFTLKDAVIKPDLGSSEDNYVFYYKGQLTVAPGMQPQSIKLKRIIGQLSIVLEDVIPDNVATFTIWTTTRYNSYQINTNTPVGIDGNGTHGILYVVKPEERGQINVSRMVNLLNTTSPITVKIDYEDANGRVLYTKTISNVNITANYRTILSGKMLTAQPSGFTITPNKDWDSRGNVVTF